jgi:acyl-CoA:acyl-CoA alkyltransferase
MRFDNVSIMSLASVDAPHRITSEELEAQIAPAMERFRAPKGILESLTGIRERRFWDAGYQPSDGATLAGECAISDANLDREKIGILISTSVSKDYIEPSVASLVHGNLKLSPHCINFDVGNACLGFINGMQIAGNMIEMGQIDYALVVCAENTRDANYATIDRINDPETTMRSYRRQFATLTLGCGAVAMVLARKDLAPDGHQLVRSVSMANTEHNRLCVGNNDGIYTDNRQLLEAGVALSLRMGDKMREQWGISPNEVDHVAMHQVSQPHTERVIEANDLDEHKVKRIYPEFGNMGPVGVPAVVAKARDEGRFKKGNSIGLYGIGSGINSMIMEVIW